ncbi:unnamed protein product [Tuber aestivum]|uniref:Kelch repeat protein n=1 Tax=Tuber aestivum TaxID=59557 RepID=A0A292PIZ4_9PEZI|nr:unnamed protein product [Tuber aestivum]
MARYPSLVAGSLLWLSALSRLSVSQSTWTLDPQKHLAQMANHMSAAVNTTIYTVGGTAYYWTPKSTPGSVRSSNNDSVYILKTSSELSSLTPKSGSCGDCVSIVIISCINKQASADSYLRALDLSGPVDFRAEFSDTTEVISELPFEIPHVKRGAIWADQDTIYFWGGELEVEPVFMDGDFQNKTREWPDPMKYYTYDLTQPKGSGTWKTVSISTREGSDKLTTSQSYGEYTYSPEARKGFYLGGVMARPQLKNKDGSNATKAGSPWYPVSAMLVFDAAANVWKNETTTQGLTELREGAMAYVPGVGEKGILVRMGGVNREDEFVGVPPILHHIHLGLCIYIYGSSPGGRKNFANLRISFAQIGFDAVFVYDIATKVWYRQSTTSKTNIYPEDRWGVFCAAAVVAPDKTSFTIYVYGGYKGSGHVKGTWALTMPYFQWIPLDSSGEPELGRSGTTCQTVGGQLALVRGRAKEIERGDPNGGTYFYDMTNLTWSLEYQPSEYQVPKTIYDIIGGNEQGGATIRGPVDDKSFAGGLGKLFAAANITDSRDPNTTNPGGGGGGGGESPTPTGAIAGGVVGGVAGLAAVGAGIWMFMRCRRLRSADVAMEGGAMVGNQESSLMGMHKHPLEQNHEGNPPGRYEMDSVPITQPVHELDNTGVPGGASK